jgi:hypothetical protein
MFIIKDFKMSFLDFVLPQVDSQSPPSNSHDFVQVLASCMFMF